MEASIQKSEVRNQKSAVFNFQKNYDIEQIRQILRDFSYDRVHWLLETCREFQETDGVFVRSIQNLRSEI